MRLCELPAARGLHRQELSAFQRLCRQRPRAVGRRTCAGRSASPRPSCRGSSSRTRSSARSRPASRGACGLTAGTPGGRGLRRHGRLVSGLRRNARRRVRRRGRHGLRVRRHDAAVPGRRRARHARLGPVGHARSVASLCLHQRRRHEPRVVRRARLPRGKPTSARRLDRLDRLAAGSRPQPTTRCSCRTWAAG